LVMGILTTRFVKW